MNDDAEEGATMNMGYKTDSLHSVREKDGNYTTRTVYFHKDGDKYFPAVKVPVSRAKYRTIEALLDDLSKKVPLDFGVRRLFTPKGRDEIRDIEQLEHYGNYICASNRKVQALKISSRLQEPPHRHAFAQKVKATGTSNEERSSWEASSSTLVDDWIEMHKSGRAVHELRAPKSKQVEFILNNAPTSRHIMRFKPSQLTLSVDEVMSCLSNAFHVGIAKLYTPLGARVIRFYVSQLFIMYTKYAISERSMELEVSGLQKELINDDSLPCLSVQSTAEVVKGKSRKQMELQPAGYVAGIGKFDTRLKGRMKFAKNCLYEVVVYTGNRWAADTDADIYIIFFGSKGHSEIIYLKQNPNDLKFQQNQADFFEVWSPYLGELRKLIIGHNEQGYGAGIFIERVMVSEPTIDDAYYAFPCSKWLDQGQVDGACERPLKCAGYSSLNAFSKEDDSMQNISAENQWKLQIKIGKIYPQDYKPELHVFTYSSVNKTRTNYSQQRRLIKVMLNQSGNFYKIRLEVDYQKCEAKPMALQIESAELLHIGTGDRRHIRCKCCCRLNADYKCSGSNLQLFREFPVVDLTNDLLPGQKLFQKKIFNCSSNKIHKSAATALRTDSLIVVYKYYGSVTLGDMCNIEQDRFFHCKIYGELGDSGIVYLDQLTSADGNLESNMTCVLEGNSWLIKSIVIRDSPHSPYQYVFTEGRILERQFPGVLRKEMILSDITGQSTKCPTRKKSDSIMEVEVWKVFITSKEQIEFDTVNGCCNLTVYGNLGNTGPIVLEERHNKFMPNKVAVFQVSFKSVGTVFKVRLEMDTTDERQMTWYLRKVKMKNINNGDEFRVNVDTLLMKSDRNSKPSIELPVSWPDIPPLPKVLYTIFIYNGHDTTENQTLSTLLTIYGEHGDSGPRMLYSKERGQKLFKPESCNQFEVEAVFLGRLRKIGITADPASNFTCWHVSAIAVKDPEGQMLYQFSADRYITPRESSVILDSATVDTVNDELVHVQSSLEQTVQ
ncbi:hypothetical protein M513_00838 [Trichuris suis]|uniref:Doublecortin n=1 Tax=Trichuris suis TaxID=68888 RepID=A0A085MLH9_9BILA|nr:hypothetical protein M513_00838 [Trichuris suis]